jgi:hypothetical protein
LAVLVEAEMLHRVPAAMAQLILVAVEQVEAITVVLAVLAARV